MDEKNYKNKNKSLDYIVQVVLNIVYGTTICPFLFNSTKVILIIQSPQGT